MERAHPVSADELAEMQKGALFTLHQNTQNIFSNMMADLST